MSLNLRMFYTNWGLATFGYHLATVRPVIHYSFLSTNFWVIGFLHHFCEVKKMFVFSTKVSTVKYAKPRKPEKSDVVYKRPKRNIPIITKNFWELNFKAKCHKETNVSC